MKNALTREETLKGMTIWAAYSNFEENEKGSMKWGNLPILPCMAMTLWKSYRKSSENQGRTYLY